MTGGGYNRVIGAELSSKERIVIRIPRFGDEIDDIVAILQFLKNYSSIPVPHILHFDLTDKNSIGSPHMVQKYVAGHPLEQLMPTLTEKNRLEITTQLAKITAMIGNTTFEHIGILRASSKGDTSGVVAAMPLIAAAADRAPCFKTLDFLLKCYNIHTQRALSLDANDKWFVGYMEKLARIAHAINKKRPFSNKFCLLHNDFMAQNIQVVTNDDGSLGLAAVFDWDDATAAPIEAAYVVPDWLWNWNPKEEEGRKNMIPALSDLRNAKETFERVIELEIPGFVSISEYGFEARELFYFAVNGLVFQEQSARIDQLANSVLGIENVA